MAAIARISYVMSHSLQHQPKNGNCRNERYISWYKYSWQVDSTISPNPILYFYCVENVKILVIKSPQYTGGDFMFLYRFVRRRRRPHRRRRRRRPQILVHAITFEQLFGFLSFLAQLLALTYRLPD